MEWQQVNDILKDKLPKNVHSLWIEPLRCLRSDEQVLELAGPDRFFCSWVAENYVADFKAALASLGQSGVEVRITAAAPEERAVTRLPLLLAGKQEQLRLPTMPKVRSFVRTLHPRYLFDEFMVGESNAVAHSACTALAHGDTSFGRCLYMAGGTGLGKSHLTHAVAHHLIKSAPGVRLNYLTAQQLTAEMVRSLKSNTMEQFKERFQHSDILLMEDMQTLTGKVKTQEELTLLFDVLMETGKSIIFTGSMAPKEIPSLSIGLRSRLSSGLVAPIAPPDLETRVLIVKRKAANHNLLLTEDVVNFLAEHITGDVRQFKSCIVGLKAKSNILRVVPDLAMAKEVLGDVIDRHLSLTAEVIRDFVAGQFKVAVVDLQSKSRKKEISFPRQVCMYLSRLMTEQGLAEIGKTVNRDHSTVVHAVRVINEAVARNSSVRGQVDILRDKLTKQYM